jgi:hypothetical protein
VQIHIGDISQSLVFRNSILVNHERGFVKVGYFDIIQEETSAESYIGLDR